MRRKVNGYLAFLVLVLAIGLTGRVLYISDIFGKDFRLIAFSEFSNLLFGATIYLFARSSLMGKPFTLNQLKHYLPGLGYVLAVVWVFMLPTDEEIREKAQSGVLFQLITVFIGTALAINIAYWMASFRLYCQVKKLLANELSYTVKTQFFRNFLFAIGLCLLFWVGTYFISIWGVHSFERLAREFIWLSIALIVLFVAYHGMVSPELYQVAAQVKCTPKYIRSKLTASDLNVLHEKLAHLMEAEKPYMNKKLLKSELADMLGVSGPELARLLNEKIGMNFFEYVNSYRVAAFVDLAKSDKAKQLTYFGLAQEVGFNSKTTFNSAFKKAKGMPPKVYFAQDSG